MQTIISIRKMMDKNHCVTKEQGERVYLWIIQSILKERKSITLDFEGIEIFGASFFNHAIGQLYGDMTTKDIQKMLTIENLSKDGMEVCQACIDNAKRYYEDVEIAHLMYKRTMEEIQKHKSRIRKKENNNA